MYHCWIVHLQYFVKLLCLTCNDFDILQSEKIYVQWRKEFVECFGADNCKFSNFLWGCHTFEDCKNFGHATWFWTLLYGMKHATYKQFNDRSNKKHLEMRAAERDMTMRYRYTMLPECRNMVERAEGPRYTLKKGIYIVFRLKDCSNRVACVIDFNTEYAQVSNIQIIGDIYSSVYMHLLTKDSEYSQQLALPLKYVLSKCSCVMFNGKAFLNQFAFCYHYCE